MMGDMTSIVVDFIALRIQILKSFIKEGDLSIEKVAFGKAQESGISYFWILTCIASDQAFNVSHLGPCSILQCFSCFQLHMRFISPKLFSDWLFLKHNYVHCQMCLPPQFQNLWTTFDDKICEPINPSEILCGIMSTD